MIENIVLYDGGCGLCSKVVRLVLKYDQKDSIYFAALQSDYGKKALAEFGVLEPDLTTFYFITNGKRLFSRSDAAIRLFSELFPKFSFTKALLVVPQCFRDSGYNFIAKNRHRFFPNDACNLPNKGEMSRFLS